MGGGASRVFLNPPYGREAEPFFRRMAGHPGGGIALVFARTDTRLWQEWVFPVADSILFLRGRLRFCDRTGAPTEPAPAPSALVAYSKADTEALRASGIPGRLVHCPH